MIDRFTVTDETDTRLADHTEQTARSAGDEGQSLTQKSQHAGQTMMIFAQFLRPACQHVAITVVMLNFVIEIPSILRRHCFTDHWIER